MAKQTEYTAEEIAILRRVYPTGGVDAAVAALPHRSRASIATKACGLSLKMTSSARGALQKRRKAERQDHKPYECRGAAAPLDTVSEEFLSVSSIFNVGQRIKK